MNSQITPLVTVFVASVLTNILVNKFLMEKHIENAVEQFPRILMTDYQQLVSDIPVNTPNNEVDQIFEKMDSYIASKAKQGYVVVDKRFIIDAPKELFVDPVGEDVARVNEKYRHLEGKKQ